MKKGIISLSVLLIALTLVFLASSVSLYNNALRTVNYGPTRLETIGSQSDAASYSLSQLASAMAANVSVSAGNITFSSDGAGVYDYPQASLQLKQFFEAYSQPGNLTLNMTDADNPIFYIRPSNISVDYTAGGAAFSPQSGAGSAGKVLGYDALLTLAQPTPSFNWTLLSNVSNTSADAIYFHIGIQGANGTASDVRYLNRSASSMLYLVGSSNSTLASFNFSSPSAMRMNYSVPVSSSITLMLNRTMPDGGLYAELGANIINARLSDGNAQNGPVISGEG